MKDLPNNHDHPHLFAALRHVRHFGTAVDAGAHRGTWTSVLVRRFERVFAFEPGPLADQITPLATVYCAALGETFGHGRLRDGPENTGQRHLDPVASGAVQVVPLDHYLNELGKVGFLKIDVEGYELFALKGAEEVIRSSRPVILIEENGLCRRYGVEQGEAESWLLRIGYRLAEKINKDHIMVPA